MNKRQAKKAFKKKYGANPEKVEQALRDFAKAMHEFCEQELPKIAEGVVEIAKRITEAAKSIIEQMEQGGES